MQKSEGLTTRTFNLITRTRPQLPEIIFAFLLYNE